jgi:hypothetical protein
MDLAVCEQGDGALVVRVAGIVMRQGVQGGNRRHGVKRQEHAQTKRPHPSAGILHQAL